MLELKFLEGVQGADQEITMDRVTRCLRCGKRMVPMPHLSGRTELKCMFCDKLDPLEVTTANKWADDNPLANPSSETAR